MKLFKEHSVYKNICLIQNDFSGKFSLVIDGKALKKTGKTTFEYIDPENGEPINVTVSGNLFKGFCLVIKTEVIQMSPPAKWYDVVLSVVAAMPCWFLIGGAIGGGLAGGMGVLSMILITQRPVIKHKIFLGVGLTAASTVAAFILALVLNALFVALGWVEAPAA